MSKRNPRPLSVDERRERDAPIIEDYAAGLSLRQIAAKRGVSMQAVHYLLRRAEIPMRGQHFVYTKAKRAHV